MPAARTRRPRCPDYCNPADICRLAVPASSNYVENGRTYHGFRRGIYMYPCDEVSFAVLSPLSGCKTANLQDQLTPFALHSPKRTAWTFTTNYSWLHGESSCTALRCRPTRIGGSPASSTWGVGQVSGPSIWQSKWRSSACCAPAMLTNIVCSKYLHAEVRTCNALLR